MRTLALGFGVGIIAAILLAFLLIVGTVVLAAFLVAYGLEGP